MDEFDLIEYLLITLKEPIIGTVGFQVFKWSMGESFPTLIGDLQYPCTRDNLDILNMELITYFKTLDSSEFSIYNAITDTIMDKNTPERVNFIEWLNYLEKKHIYFRDKEAVSCYNDLLLIKKHIQDYPKVEPLVKPYEPWWSQPLDKDPLYYLFTFFNS